MVQRFESAPRLTFVFARQTPPVVPNLLVEAIRLPARLFAFRRLNRQGASGRSRCVLHAWPLENVDRRSRRRLSVRGRIELVVLDAAAGARFRRDSCAAAVAAPWRGRGYRARGFWLRRGCLLSRLFNARVFPRWLPGKAGVAPPGAGRAERLGMRSNGASARRIAHGVRKGRLHGRCAPLTESGLLVPAPAAQRLSGPR
jgi:hypothetical protein